MEGAQYIGNEQLSAGMDGWAKCLDKGYENKYFPATILEVLGGQKKARGTKKIPSTNVGKDPVNDKEMKKKLREEKKAQLEESSEYFDFSTMTLL